MKLLGYLMIHRVDLAEKELEKMVKLDSSGDSAVYKLSKAFFKVRTYNFL